MDKLEQEKRKIREKLKKRATPIGVGGVILHYSPLDLTPLL